QEARQAASSPAETTVLLSDPNGILDAAQLRTVLALGSEVVAIDPGFPELSTIAPGVAPAGSPTVSASKTPRCTDVPAAQNAGSVAGVRSAYRVTRSGTGCFPVGTAY